MCCCHLECARRPAFPCVIKIVFDPGAIPSVPSLVVSKTKVEVIENCQDLGLATPSSLSSDMRFEALHAVLSDVYDSCFFVSHDKTVAGDAFNELFKRH